jgi:hypothetical protein
MPEHLQKLVVKWRVIGGPASKDAVDRPGFAVELTGEGLVLLSKRPFPVGTQVEVKLPDRSVQGVVASASEPDDAGDVRLAVAAGLPEEEPAVVSLISDEKRGHPRKAVKIFVKYRCVSKGVNRDINDRVGVVTDIAKVGLRIKALREYVPGTILELQVAENALGPGPKRTLYAKVVWRAKAEKEGEFTHGACFVKLSKPVPAEGM